VPKRIKLKLVKHVSRWHSYGLLGLSVTLNAVAFPLVKPAFSTTTPFRFLFYRFVVAAILSMPILWHFGRKHQITLKRVGLITLIEALACIFTLGVLYLGLARTTSLEANLISTASPIFTVLAGVIYLKEKEERHEWLGLLLAFTGTLMIIFLPILMGRSSFSFMSFTGNALILLQNITGAFGLILAKKYYVHIPKLLVTSVTSYVAVIGFGLLAYWELGGLQHQFTQVIAHDLTQPSVLIAVFYMSIFCSLIATTAYLKGQECIEASEASLFSYLSPLVFFPVSVFVLREGFNFLHLVGLLIILTGIVIAEARVRRLIKVKPKKA